MYNSIQYEMSPSTDVWISEIGRLLYQYIREGGIRVGQLGFGLYYVVYTLTTN